MSARPVSCPTGAAPARHSLMPLYWAGLWLAVNIAPGASRCPDAKYTRSVEARPSSTTSTPASVAPSANAALSGSEDGRSARESHERVAHPAGDVVVELVGVDAADVVGLEDRVESLVVRHSAAGYPPLTPGPLAVSRRVFCRLRHHGHTARPPTPTR